MKENQDIMQGTNDRSNIENAVSQTQEEAFSLEESFDKLEEIVTVLEDSSISLEDSFRAYEEGMKLLKECNQKIDQVEKQVLVLNAEGGLDEF